MADFLSRIASQSNFGEDDCEAFLFLINLWYNILKQRK